MLLAGGLFAELPKHLMNLQSLLCFLHIFLKNNSGSNLEVNLLDKYHFFGNKLWQHHHSHPCENLFYVCASTVSTWKVNALFFNLCCIIILFLVSFCSISKFYHCGHSVNGVLMIGLVFKANAVGWIDGIFLTLPFLNLLTCLFR